MSEPITYELYRPEQVDDGVVRWIVAGKFVERAWCGVHNLPMALQDKCVYGHLAKAVRQCVPEPSPRLVQEPPQ